MMQKANAETAGRKVRIAHLVSHPIQYLVPIYKEIAASQNVEFDVYYYSDSSLGKHYDAGFGREFTWSTALLDGYKYRLLPSSKGKELGKVPSKPNWDVLTHVIRGKYDVVWINSYIGVNALLMRIAGLFLGIPIFFRDDTNLLTPRPFWKQLAKHLLLRPFLFGTWAYYVGKENNRYWRSFGVPQRRLFHSPHCVDNKFWSAKADAMKPYRDQIRRSFGIADDSPVILFCGKFIPKKQPLLLLSAFNKVRRRFPCWLLMVGDGPLRGAMERLIQESQTEGIILAGFLNQDELPRAYTAADALVLPSENHETWGLVVNEAMNFSLPIVLSNRVGCSSDLVDENWNGYIFAHDDVDALAEVLSALIQSAEKRAVFGRNSKSRIAEYSAKACAEGIIKGAREASGVTASPMEEEC